MPNSLAKIISTTPWASHPGAPVSVLGTVTRVAPASFSRAPGNRPLEVHLRSHFHPLLAITALQRLWCSRREITLLGLSRYVRSWTKTMWCRNINPLPFRISRLRKPLGPTNPRLTNIAEEPLPFRRMGFQPILAVTPTRIRIRTRSTGPCGPASTHARRLPTRPPCGAPEYRWLASAPSILEARSLD